MPGAIPVEPATNLGGQCRQLWPRLFSDGCLAAPLTLFSLLGFVYEEQRTSALELWMLQEVAPVEFVFGSGKQYGVHCVRVP